MPRAKTPLHDLVVPLAREEVSLSRRKVETGRVRIHKRVEQREQPVLVELLREEVQVKRIPVNRVVDVQPEVRNEGDLLVIPVLEEVVQKRWLLKEEVHVRRRAVRAPHRETVVLRSEKVTVERQKRRPGGGSST